MQVTESSQQGRQLRGRIPNSEQNVSSPCLQIAYPRDTATGGRPEEHTDYTDYTDL